MSNYATLKTAIQSAVYTNGNNEITGAGLQAVLLQIVNTVGDGYVFKGVATAGTAPGTPDANVFYIAPAGTYTNFGGTYNVPSGSIGVFMWNGNWYKYQIPITGVKEETKSIPANSTVRYFSLTSYVGQNVSVKVDGTFSQFGYYRSGGSYTVVGTTSGQTYSINVPSDATDLFVFSRDAGTATMTLYTGFSALVISNENRINELYKYKLGYCYGGTLTIDATGHTFTTNFQYVGIGTGTYKTAVNVNAQAIAPISGGSYNGYWLAYLNWETARVELYMFSNVPSDTSSLYLVATGYGLTNVQFCTVNTSPSLFRINERFDRIGVYNYNATIAANSSATITSLTAYIGKKISVKVSGTFSQFGYYVQGGSYEIVGYNADEFYTFEVPSNATNLFVFSRTSTSVTVELRTELASEIAENASNIELLTPDAIGCVLMALGDSISTESYYMPILRQILKPSKYYNVSVASATWADKAGTTSYDGNPQFSGDQNQNVLGNQVQKILNNPSIYDTPPDIIIISAGTNDATPSATEQEWETIEGYFTENDGANSVQCTTPTFDAADTFMASRKKITGAMRYVCTRLMQLYPSAKIFILTPIQGSFNPNKNFQIQRQKQQHIANVAKHMSLPVIHVGEECGIDQEFEYGGYFWDSSWATETYPKNGRDLIDGLHPNASGSRKMAKYIANELLKRYVK